MDMIEKGVMMVLIKYLGKFVVILQFYCSIENDFWFISVVVLLEYGGMGFVLVMISVVFCYDILLYVELLKEMKVVVWQIEDGVLNEFSKCLFIKFGFLFEVEFGQIYFKGMYCDWYFFSLVEFNDEGEVFICYCCLIGDLN